MNEEELMNEFLGEPSLAQQQSVSSGFDEGLPRTSISNPRTSISNPKTVQKAIPRHLWSSPIYQKRLEEEEDQKKQINAEIEEFRKKSKVDREEREKVRAKLRETLYHGGKRKKILKNTKDKKEIQRINVNPKEKRKQKSTKKR